MTQALGYHYLIELHDCNRTILTNKTRLRTALQQAATIAGSHQIGEVFHEFSPHGVSGVILISESHFSIHTWPEKNYAAVDFFTCNDKLQIQAAYQYLIQELHAQKYSIQEIKRGLINPSK
jgi:S-adenosylmethionine decarboxylase proenzyme